MNTSPTAAVLALYQALEAGKHGAALRPCFTEDATTLEHPNLIKPRGATVTLPEMLAASSAGAGLLKEQRYEIRSLLEVPQAATGRGALVIVRVRWTATIGKSLGPFHEGQTLKANLAQFIETREDRVASIETFDCYEPFTG